MVNIAGFESLNLDLIYEVEDLKLISSRERPLISGQEVFGSEMFTMPVF